MHLPQKKVSFSTEARKAILDGANIVANAVKVTLGPRGKIVLYEGMIAQVATKDGVTVAKQVSLKDKNQAIGCEMIKEVAGKTNDIAGDGTTTATILAQAIINEGFKMVETGANEVLLKRGLEKARDAVVEKLKEMSRKTEEKQDVINVASISANDKELGKIIGEAMFEVGKDGVVGVEEGSISGDSKETTKGFKVDVGYNNYYFINNSERMTCEFDDANILVTDEDLTAWGSCLGFFNKLADAGLNKLVVIANNVDGEVLTGMVQNKIKGTFLTCVVKAPDYGDRRKKILEDIAIATGATFVTSDKGMKLVNEGLDILGKARKIIVSRKDTLIIGGNSLEEKVEERIKEITAEIGTVSSEWEKEKLHERISRLKGSASVIKIGGASESEMQEKKDRVQDAINATRAAMEEGIVVGGGVALLNARDIESLNLTGDEALGANILIKALEYPIRQLAKNAGKSPEVIIEKLNNLQPEIGWNAETDEIGNMFEFGIVDPTKVVRIALESAVSVAGLFLLTEAVITEEPADSVPVVMKPQ